jgi:hypothetical protein
MLRLPSGQRTVDITFVPGVFECASWRALSAVDQTREARNTGNGVSVTLTDEILFLSQISDKLLRDVWARFYVESLGKISAGLLWPRTTNIRYGCYINQPSKLQSRGYTFFHLLGVTFAVRNGHGLEFRIFKARFERPFTAIISCGDEVK